VSITAIPYRTDTVNYAEHVPYVSGRIFYCVLRSFVTTGSNLKN